TWQRDADVPQYLAPALLGSNVGATLVYEAQLQSPPTAFSAAIVVDPESTVSFHPPFCEHPAATRTPNGQRVRADPPGSNVPLRVLLDSAATPSQRAFAAS